jgi:hypothetical protein
LVYTICFQYRGFSPISPFAGWSLPMDYSILQGFALQKATKWHSLGYIGPRRTERMRIA